VKCVNIMDAVIGEDRICETKVCQASIPRARNVAQGTEVSYSDGLDLNINNMKEREF
jgi:hypothetical protein